MAGETVRIVQALRAAIHGGKFLPGEQLRQESLAAEFEVSRVPLREALLVLSHQGLLEHRNNQGFRVAKRSSAELDQLLWLIDTLEPRVYERIEWPSLSSLSKLEKLNDAMAAVEGTDSATFALLNEQFHSLIWRHSPEQVIVGELEKIWSLGIPALGPLYSMKDGRMRAVREHQAIIDALRARDHNLLLAAETAHRHATFP